MYSHRAPPPQHHSHPSPPSAPPVPPTTMTPRYIELLEALRHEYEALYHEFGLSKMHRDDHEFKAHAQLVDIAGLQKAFYELERAHLKMKQQYEEEITRLKHELEERGGPSFVPGTSAAALITFPTPPNLEAELQGYGQGFSNLISSSTGGTTTSGTIANTTIVGIPGSIPPPPPPISGALTTDSSFVYGKRGGPEGEEGHTAAWTGRNVRAREETSASTTTSTTSALGPGTSTTSRRASIPTPLTTTMVGSYPSNAYPAAYPPSHYTVPYQHSLGYGGGPTSMAPYHPYQQHPIPPPPPQAYPPQAPPAPSSHHHHHYQQAASYYGRPLSISPNSDTRAIGGIHNIPPLPPTTATTTTATINSPSMAPHAPPTHTPIATTAPSSGFDWLVVYNPKANRTLSIDLLQTFLHDNVVCCVRFSADGRYLATGSNRLTSIFDVKRGEKVASLIDKPSLEEEQSAGSLSTEGSDQFIRSVAFSADGRWVVTGSEDQIVRVWEMATQKLKCRLQGHTQDIYAVDFLPNGREVISGSGDRTVRIWDIEEGQCRFVLNVLPISDSIPSPNNHNIVNTHGGGNNNNNNGTSQPTPVRDSGITSVAVSPNGKYIAAGSLDRTIRIWDIESGEGKQIEVLEGHRDSVYSVAFAPDGRHLISGSLDRTIKVWQFDTADLITRGTCKYTVLGHKDYVLSVATTPGEGRWVVSGSKDRSVQFWDSQNGSTQLMLQGHKNSVISVAVSPASGVFATGSGDCRARIWSFTPISSTATTANAMNYQRTSAKSPVPSTGSTSSSSEMGLIGSSSTAVSALRGTMLAEEVSEEDEGDEDDDDDSDDDDNDNDNDNDDKGDDNNNNINTYVERGKSRKTKRNNNGTGHENGNDDEE